MVGDDNPGGNWGSKYGPLVAAVRALRAARPKPPSKVEVLREGALRIMDTFTADTWESLPERMRDRWRALLDEIEAARDEEASDGGE